MTLNRAVTIRETDSTEGPDNKHKETILFFLFQAFLEVSIEGEGSREEERYWMNKW